MQLAANCGPIVVINVSEYRCDAILIEQHQIRFLALPDVHCEDIDEGYIDEKQDLGSLEILEWLWDTIMDPILCALGYTQPPSNGDWPHVWWIPTGPLTKYPLHAAGRYTKNSSESVLDRVMSSYSSSIKHIIYGRRRSILPSTSIQVLLVAMEHTPGYSKLHFATKEIELLYDLCKSMAFNPIKPEQYKQDIMSHLPQSKIFHFAGHGYTDEDDPSRSCLLLKDGKNNPLMVANLLEMNLRKHAPFLAYLSACGIGQIRDFSLVDESIHLITACQLAGFRHVIGTLWKVNDDICVDMARITYEEMRNGGMTDESVCRGLHEATRQPRDRWLIMPKEVKHGSRTVREIGASLMENGTGAQSPSDGDKKDVKLPRDVLLCDDSDDDDYDDRKKGSLNWVPYVHFGV
jgi:CHAT domain-containing protein